MRSEEEARFRVAASKFWNDPKLDITEALLDLSFPKEWTVFDLDTTGKTDYRGLFRDEKIGIYLFRSASGGKISPHWHRFPERVVFIRGRGSLVLHRDYDNPLDLSVHKSVLIPAETLHEGGDFEDGNGGSSLSLCVFYYGMLTD